MDSEEEASVSQAFDAFLAEKDRNVTHLYIWEVIAADHPRVTLLSNTALRLQSIICSEAASERAIGQQRRHLTPHRMRTKRDLLLAPTQMEDGHQTRSHTSRLNRLLSHILDPRRHCAMERLAAVARSRVPFPVRAITDH
jgi:S-adenosylmethionine:diacylglycerol 3-amino-3-carboxypropyl transferase